MSWALESPAYLVLAAALLFGAGLGFGGVTGKGMILFQRFKNNGFGKESTPAPPHCSMEVCKEHSGLVADVKHLIKGNDEIKVVLNELWGAVNELRKELMNRRGGAV